MSSSTNEWISVVYTVADKMKILDCLRGLQESVYRTQGQTWNEVLTTRIDEDVAEIITKKLSQGSGELSVSQKNSIVQELITSVNELEICKITLAVKPPREIIKSICNWLRSNVTGNIILDVLCNPDMLAGVIISYQGKYGDYSLRSRFDTLWAEKKEMLLAEVFHE